MPLFTGGRIKGDQLVAEANLREAQARYDQAREFAALDARVTINDLLEARAAWQASQGTAEQAARAYSIAEVRYREGISTQLELNDSRILLEQAVANRALAARNLQVARVKLALLPNLPLLRNNAGQAQASAQSLAQPSVSPATPTPNTQSGAQAAAASARPRHNPAFQHSNRDETHMKKPSSKTYKIGGGILLVLLVLFAIFSRSKGDNASAAETTKAETISVGTENIAVATTSSIMSGPALSGTLEPEREAVLRAQVREAFCRLTPIRARPSAPERCSRESMRRAFRTPTSRHERGL